MDSRAHTSPYGTMLLREAPKAILGASALAPGHHTVLLFGTDGAFISRTRTLKE